MAAFTRTCINASRIVCLEEALKADDEICCVSPSKELAAVLVKTAGALSAMAAKAAETECLPEQPVAREKKAIRIADSSE